MLAVRSLLCGGSNACNITASKRLCDGQANLLLSAETFFGHLLLQLLVVQPLSYSRQRDHHPGEVAVLEASRISPGEFLRRDQVVEVVKVLSFDAAQQNAPVKMLSRSYTHCKYVGLGHPVDELLRNVSPVLLLLLCLGCNISIDKLAELPS